MINRSTKYGSQIATDANYPNGKARNDTVAGDGTGTPLEADWVNDIFGFQDAVAEKAGITASGTPDDAADSQVLEGLETIFGRQIARYRIGDVGGSYVSAAQRFSLEEASEIGGFTLVSGDRVQVPQPGLYLLLMHATLQGNTGAAHASVEVSINLTGSASNLIRAGGSYAQNYNWMVSGNGFVQITDPATETIEWRSGSSSLRAATDGSGLVIVNLGIFS